MSAYVFISVSECELNNIRTFTDISEVKSVACVGSADGFKVREGYLSSTYQRFIFLSPLDPHFTEISG